MSRRVTLFLIATLFACGDDASPEVDAGPGVDAMSMDASPGIDAADGALPDPSVNLHFESSFETARGRSDEALLDGNRWDRMTQDRESEEVVGAENGVEPIDGENMLKVSIDGEALNGGVVVHDGIDLDSDDHFIRFYVNVQCLTEPVSFAHYVEDLDEQLGLADSQNFYWTVASYNPETGRYRMGVQAYAEQEGGCEGPHLGGRLTTWGRIGAPSPDIESDDDPNGLECGEWYRIEVNVSCMDAGCMNMGRDTAVPVEYHLHVYDEAGTQIIGDGQMRSMSRGGDWLGFSAGDTLEEAYERGSCYVMTSGRPSFGIIQNGQQGVTATADAWMYFDRVAISNEGWVGP